MRWDFATGEGPAGATGSELGADPAYDVDDLRVEDGLLRGRTTGDKPVIDVPVPAGVELGDALHAVEVRLWASAGTEVGLLWSSEEEIDEEKLAERLEDEDFELPLHSPLEPGEELHTITLSTAGTMLGTLALGGIRHLGIVPTDADGAEFGIESVRVISRRQYLHSVPSGVSWQGLAGIFRETIVTRAPERMRFDLRLPDRPWLDLALGQIEDGVSTFEVAIREGDGPETTLLQRTLTSKDRWEPVALDLADYAGRDVTLVMSGEAETPGMLQYWGGPVIRQRHDATRTVAPSPARAALSDRGAPRGIVFILVDTLRRDRLPWYGGSRDDAPNLARLAEQGTVFTHDVSQATWTKVSVPAILTSLYPTSHGITLIPDRLPSSVTTLAEAVHDAGYVTFATSSVPFSGKLTNLHQGVEVLHESESVPELPYSSSKTGRTFVDRLLPWLDAHADEPFFVFLHAFDPHSPFEPYAPYNTLYADGDEIAAHRERMKKVQEHIDNDHMRRDVMPTSEELAEAGVDAATFVDTEHDWYDGSIRGIDAEIGRVVERLRQLGLAEDTLIVFMSDHGEEFLDHGRHFHGKTAYGEMLNVPLMMWWPGVVPAGRSDEIVESIDVYPTVLDLALVPVPEQAQGQSLLPLMAGTREPSRLGWVARPAFAERAFDEPEDEAVKDHQVESLVIIADGWKLIRNGRRPADWPEFELYDYVNDPLDQEDVAADHPDVVERLAGEIESWHEMALAERVEETDDSTLSDAERERLRSLGYIQ